MDLSIIIVNFRTFDVTVNCIKSIVANLAKIEYEIILVDNAPKEDLGAEFQEIFKGLIYIKSEENIGFGRANNLGMATSIGKFVLLINSDTIVFDDSLLKCYYMLEGDKNEEIGLLGCKLLNGDKSFQPSFYPFKKNSLINYLLSNNWILNKLFKVSKLFQETYHTLEVGDVSGAFMLLRKKVIERVGGFDPDFFLYCEETEWCRERISKYFKIVYFPHASIIHLGGQSAPRQPMIIQSKLSRALLWYKKGWISYLFYLVITYLNLLIHTLLLFFVQKESRKVIIADIISSIKVLPYLFTEVVKYKRNWGSRNTPLIYEGARSIFFG